MPRLSAMLPNNKPDITMQFLMLSIICIETASVAKISTSPLLVGSLSRSRIRLLPGRTIFRPCPIPLFYFCSTGCNTRFTHLRSDSVPRPFRACRGLAPHACRLVGSPGSACWQMPEERYWVIGVFPPVRIALPHWHPLECVRT
jgi:hypothetical protein